MYSAQRNQRADYPVRMIIKKGKVMNSFRTVAMAFFAAMALGLAPAHADDPKLPADVLVHRGGTNHVLKLVNVIDVPAIANFQASAKYIPSQDATHVMGLDASYDESFVSAFFDKVEPTTEAVKLRVLDVAADTTSPSAVIAALGEGYEISLGQLFALLQSHPSPLQKGIFVTNTWANVAFVRDMAGSLWIVSFGNSPGGLWYISARPASDTPITWGTGTRIISY